MTVTYLAAGTTSWQVPAGVSSVKIECLGAGGPTTATARTGGGGGAYSADTVSVTPGETLTVQVPASVAGSTPGDCYVKRGTTTLVLAKSGGYAPTMSAQALGGSAASGVGAIRYSGGNAGPTPTGVTHQHTGF